MSAENRTRTGMGPLPRQWRAGGAAASLAVVVLGFAEPALAAPPSSPSAPTTSVRAVGGNDCRRAASRLGAFGPGSHDKCGVGPTGPRGATGPTGPTGATGATGPAGPGGTEPVFGQFLGTQIVHSATLTCESTITTQNTTQCTQPLLNGLSILAGSAEETAICNAITGMGVASTMALGMAPTPYAIWNGTTWALGSASVTQLFQITCNR
ncbi:hypothetical protein ABZ845_23925 [Streptomyces sp. NPDC047022]|uniref:hypothetical protein n=1 Tax=Streptomyces sp. NPDC047022 TaxID=3155737 RepID=UPI0033CF918C